MLQYSSQKVIFSPGWTTQHTPPVVSSHRASISTPSHHSGHLLNSLQIDDYLLVQETLKLGAVLLMGSDERQVKGDNPFLLCAAFDPVSATQNIVSPLCCHSTAGLCSTCCSPDPQVPLPRAVPQLV